MQRKWKFHLWKIGTINIRTGKEDQKLSNCINEIHKSGLSICALQEVRRLGKGSATINVKLETKRTDYEIYWSGHSHKRIHGVGFAIKTDKNIEINEIIPINARVIIADVTVYGCSLRIVNCYAPTEEDSDSSKFAFYTYVKKQISTAKPTQKVICLGDFNSTSSATWCNSSLRENSVIDNLEVNDNGQRFHDFFNTCRLSVLNTWFTHRRCRRITWYSPDGKTQKVYDFILTSSWLRQYTTNCRVYNSFDFDSDHRLVIATLNTPCTKFARYKKQEMKAARKKLDMTSLENHAIKTDFNTNLSANLNDKEWDTKSNEFIQEHLTNSINTAAENSIPKTTATKLQQPWHNDAKLKELYAKKDALMTTNSSSSDIPKLRKKIRLRARYLKNEHFKAEASKINQLQINREVQKLFARAKRQETTLRPIPTLCPTENLLEHFKSHFNPPDPSVTKTQNDLYDTIPNFVNDLQQISESTNIKDTAPDIEEIIKHIKQLKSNKAYNDIDLIKRCDNPIMHQVIYPMIYNL